MFSDVRYRLRAIFRRPSMERELSEELHYHVERQVAKLVDAGVPRQEAIRRARLAIGGVEPLKEECRDARGVSTVETTMQDLRYAVRQLRKAPGFAAVVTASLALGIGANTAIFTLIDALLLRNLPVAQPSELYFVGAYGPDGSSRGFGYPEVRRLQEANPVFSGVAAYATTRLNVSVGGSVEPTADGHLVSGNYFTLLGLRPAAGRVIGPEDDRIPNGHPVAVLSYAYWQRRFAGDPSIVGGPLTLSGVPFTVIGVAPRRFSGLEVGREADIFVPVVMQPTVMPATENWLQESMARSFWLTAIGRLSGDRTAAQATSALVGLTAVLDPLYTKPSRPGERPQLIPERLVVTAAATGASSLRQQYAQPLFVLMTVVALVLLVACTNVASLMLARAAARVPELSMRLALGAGRWRLVRQLLVESLVLSAAGGVGGLLVARWATGVLVSFMSSGRVPIVLDLEPHPGVLAFTAGVSLLTGILCGFVPAWRASRVDVIAGLKRQARGAGGGWIAPGRILVASQVALCLVLLFAAGLFVRSLQRLDSQDAGFDRESVLLVRVEPKGSDQRGVPGASERLDTIYRDLIARVSALPGVRSASMAHFAPTARVGYAAPIELSSGEKPVVARMMAYPRYFETMGIALIGGRDLEARDLEAGSPGVAVVNQAFVRQIMKGENPVGRTVRDERGREVRAIVGVVSDSKYGSLREDTPPLIYQPFLQTNTGRGQMTLHVRTSGDAPAVASRVREAVQQVDPSMPLFTVFTLAAHMDGALGQQRLVATISSLFGALALLLASIGLYGLMAFAVVRRTSEMGIRMALGAARQRVVRMVMREALLLVAIGLAAGIPIAVVAGRFAGSRISGLLFGLGATDPATMLGAAALLLLVAAVAAYLPAIRAGRVDPIVALRSE